MTFVISWTGLMLVLGGPAAFPASPDRFDRLLPFPALTLTAGPSLAALLLTHLVSGRAGFGELFTDAAAACADTVAAGQADPDVALPIIWPMTA